MPILTSIFISSVYFTSTFLVHFIFYRDLALSSISSFRNVYAQTWSNYSNFDLICSLYCCVSPFIDHMSRDRVKWGSNKAVLNSRSFLMWLLCWENINQVNLEEAAWEGQSAQCSGVTCAASHWSNMLLESSYWLTTSNPHPLEQSVDKHNKIIRSGIIIVLTLVSVSSMESPDNRL